jgi:hypothetical protein
VTSMRVQAVVLSLTMFGLFGACAQPTPYQPEVDGYGYSEHQIEDNRYWVSFAGNSLTPARSVQDYWLYRIAELTLDHGYDYFIVVDRQLEQSTSHSESEHEIPPFVSEDGTIISGASTISSSTTSHSYVAFGDVVMFEGDKPAAEVNAYDARNVLRRLGPTIQAAPGVMRRVPEQPESQQQTSQQ